MAVSARWAKPVFGLERNDDGLDHGIAIRRSGDEWTITTGGRLQDGWWVKARRDLGVACLARRTRRVDGAPSGLAALACVRVRSSAVGVVEDVDRVFGFVEPNA
ncbi:MAG TPA: hypothetical protein VGO31_14655 [Microbacteriaceae bacterium]|nr:hypothetical protein [Microbacteriaceae bacterium]